MRGRARAVLLALGLAACDAGAPGEDDALARLERLAFVPPGECRLLTRDADVVCANREALLVDRFEVTRGEWEAWRRTPGAPGLGSGTAPLTDWPDAATSWPATGMDLSEARAFAAARGMRLPTAREWLRIASGTRAHPWPWGVTTLSSVADTAELGIRSPVPVGTFEQGASPESVYDLIGNVAEWVEEPIRAIALDDLEVTPLAWAMGGSYATRLGRLHELDRAGRLVVQHVDLDPRTRAADVGLRCVVEARSWLLAHVDGLRLGPDAPRRLAAIGRRWGRAAAPLLDELAARPGASTAFRHLAEGARS